MDYAQLKTDVADWLMREDMTDVIPSLIHLAEARLNRTLRMRQMVKRATSEVNGQYLSLPGDWLEARNVQLNLAQVQPLEFVTLQQADYYRAISSGKPWAYSIAGKEMEVIPVVDDGTEIEMAYYAKIPALSDSNTTNWLLDEWPDLYLYGTLAHSAPYLKEDERVQTWAALYDRALDEAVRANMSAEYSGGPLKVRARTMG